MRVGMVGCGVISQQYLATLPALPDVELVAAADLDPARAEAAAAGREGVRALAVDELLAAPEVDTVLNLTIPAAHTEIALRSIAAGKHVYSEKPLSVTTSDAREIPRAADEAGVLVGCAPDTVLGTGTQTARTALDGGRIGTPISATATMISPGPEPWHPQPDFYYVPGGGPLLDMGPYYIHALVTLLGPVRSVIGAASRLRSQRVIGSGPRTGETIPVSTDTHVTGVLVHRSGVLSTLVMSFDGVATTAHPIEVQGTEGTLGVPDPNLFDGPVRLHRSGGPGWEELPISGGYMGAGRGVGLQDMAARSGSLRASGALALHVLETMNSLLDSAREGHQVQIRSTAERPEAVELTRADAPS